MYMYLINFSNSKYGTDRDFYIVEGHDAYARIISTHSCFYVVAYHPHLDHVLDKHAAGLIRRWMREKVVTAKQVSSGFCVINDNRECLG